MDKKINIGVNKQEYDSVMRSVSTDAKKLASDMIRSAREQEKSSSEVIRSIKEQIRLLQEKQRILRDTERTELSARLSSGQISEAKYGAGNVVIGERSNRDDRLIKEVKNVIEAIKSSSKEEIREDRKTTETHINSLRRGRGVGTGSDEFDNLREISADSQINKQQQRAARAGMNPIQAYGMGEGMAGGNIPMGALNALGASRFMKYSTNPWVLGAAAIGGATLKSEDVALEKTRDLFKVYGSGDSETARAVARRTLKSTDLVRMGVNPLDALGAEANLMRSSGGRQINYNDLLSAVAVSKIRDVSDTDVQGMYGVSRYSSSGNNPLSDIRGMEMFLKGIERPIAQLPDLINQYLATSNQIIMSQGSVNGQGVQNLIAGVTSSYGAEGVNIGRHVRAASFVGSRQNKVAGASHLQIRAARKVLGSQASMLEVDMLRDNPSHEKYQDYMKELSSNMMGMRGGGEGAARVMEQMYGGNLGLTELDKMVKGKQMYTPTSVPQGDDFKEIYQKNATDMTSTLEHWKVELKRDMMQLIGAVNQVVTNTH